MTELFDNTFSLVRPHSEDFFGFGRHMFIGTVSFERTYLEVRREAGILHRYHFWRINYSEIFKVVVCGQRVKCYWYEGVACIGFPFRPILELRSMTDFIRILESKLVADVIIEYIEIQQYEDIHLQVPARVPANA